MNYFGRNILRASVNKWKKSLKLHDEKAEFLGTLATLLGFTEDIGGLLPDGSRPDVLRIDRSRKSLFIGDAKQTEFPGCSATQSRLFHYLQWMSNHIRNGGKGVFSVCYRRKRDTLGWLRTVSMLGRETDLVFYDQAAEEFEPGLYIAWFITN